MITVEQAVTIIQSHEVDFGSINVPIHDAVQKVLAENIYADRDFPPFDRVTMDGIAIFYDAHTEKKQYPVEHISAAGSPVYKLKNKANCVEVMTGCMMPEGCDTVIRYEDLEKVQDSYKILGLPPKGKNVHRKASDFPHGNLLLKRGHAIRAAEINILATVGKTNVSVFKQPKIIILSSGDELVDIDKQPLAHQIRKSNAYMIQAALKNRGIETELLHITDNEFEITQTFRRLHANYDVFILSGGVSMGKYDFIPSALQAIGIKQQFHKVKQRPGKPFWFGSDESTTVFAFPGNPVSTLVGTHHYLLPWLEKNQTLGGSPKPYVTLAENYEFKPELTLFLHCTLSPQANGETLATPIPTNGSGDLVSPAYADGFIVLPKDQTKFNKGQTFPFYTYNL